MASTNADSENLGSRRRTWRKKTRCLSFRLFCCSCLQGEEKNPLQEQEEKINGGPQYPCLDQQGSGEQEAIQITVEDLGIVNASFSMFEEEPLTQRSSMARSASSASACQSAILKKKRLKPLSSLPVQFQVEQAITHTTGTDDEKEEDLLLFESGTDGPAVSGRFLTPPAINLIPPTPSDIVDDDQFFEINSEESVANTSVSDGSCGAEDQGNSEEMIESVEPKESKEAFTVTEDKAGPDSAAEHQESINDQFEEEREAVPANREEKEKSKPRFSRSAYQVAPLPEYTQKRHVNTGINLLSFTEHNLDDLSSTDVTCSDILKADFCRLPYITTMDTVTHQRRPITRSCSFGDTLTRSSTFHALTQTTDKNRDEEVSPRQRRKTVASYMPQSKDQNGNFAEKNIDGRISKSLKELNIDEVCQWFTSIGLQKCLPFIREAKLRGEDIAAVDVKTLDTLHITTLEDREQLLSAIYNELHPASTITQRLDTLLESLGPNNVETFTTTLLSMSKSKSSPHVGCLSMNQRSLKLRNNSQNCMAQKNSHLIEITINASQRIVHLRTPKETTVGKIMDSCMKMLGMTEDTSLFTLKDKEDSSDALSLDQQIGSLLTSSSDNRQLELHFCKTDKPSASQNNAAVNSLNDNNDVNKNVQVHQPAKDGRIRELNQQVDSLQNVILQVQELHHGLVAFCSELKNMNGELDVERLGSVELKQRLEMVESRMNDKKQSLQSLRDNINNPAAFKKKQLEVRLLEKIKLNCEVFKEEISLVHLTRQLAQLQNALEESYIKEKKTKNGSPISSLSQLVSPQSPAMLLVVQENQGPEGCYGFTCHYREGSGLMVVQADHCNLCVDDRLVEVNGVPVVNSTTEELTDLLLQGPSAQIVVLRQPPPTLTSHQPLLFQQQAVNPDPMQTVCSERDVVTMDTAPRRKVMAI